MTAPHDAGHITLTLAPAVLELDFVKANAESIRSDLAHAPVIVKIHIAEAGMPRGSADTGATGANRIAAQLSLLTLGLSPLVRAIAAMSAAVVSMPGLNDQTRVRAEAGVQQRRLPCDRVSQCWGGDEGGRGKGNDRRSGVHDLLHHECRKPRTVRTRPERRVHHRFQCGSCSFSRLSRGRRAMFPAPWPQSGAAR